MSTGLIVDSSHLGGSLTTRWLPVRGRIERDYFPTVPCSHVVVWSDRWRLAVRSRIEWDQLLIVPCGQVAIWPVIRRFAVYGWVESGQCLVVGCDHTLRSLRDL
jgi:hypothetical protein